MNRQQQPDKDRVDMLRDAQADLGLRCPHMQKQSFSYDMAFFLCVLRFYGPVNPMGSCRARSVYLTTRLLGRQRHGFKLVIKALKCQTWFSGKTNNRKLSYCRLLNLHREW